LELNFHNYLSKQTDVKGKGGYGVLTKKNATLITSGDPVSPKRGGGKKGARKRGRVGGNEKYWEAVRRLEG